MIEDIYKLVGHRIREERIRLKITQERLAELAELSVAFIGQIERGVNKASLLTIQKIADALNIQVGKLFTNVPAKKTEYTLTDQIESILQDKTPKEKRFAKELIQFVFKEK